MWVNEAHALYTDIVAHEYGHHAHANVAGGNYGVANVSFKEGFAQFFMWSKEIDSGVLGKRLLNYSAAQGEGISDKLQQPHDEWIVASFFLDTVDDSPNEGYIDPNTQSECGTDESLNTFSWFLDSLNAAHTSASDWAATTLSNMPSGTERDALEVVADYFEAIASPDVCPD